MLNIEEINKEIAKLENKDYLTYDLCNKLATLYIVRKYYTPQMKTSNSIDMDISKSPLK